MKQELLDYVRQLEHQIDDLDQKATAAEGSVEYAGYSQAAFELRMVRYHLLKIVMKHEQSNRVINQLKGGV